MAYRIEFSKRALRKFEALPIAVQNHLKPIISSLSNDSRPARARNVKELDMCYRLRSGNYRIVYAVRDDVLLVLVLTVADRREVYSPKEIAAVRKELRKRLREDFGRR